MIITRGFIDGTLVTRGISINWILRKYSNLKSYCKFFIQIRSNIIKEIDLISLITSQVSLTSNCFTYLKIKSRITQLIKLLTKINFFK